MTAAPPARIGARRATFARIRPPTPSTATKSRASSLMQPRGHAPAGLAGGAAARRVGARGLHGRWGRDPDPDRKPDPARDAGVGGGSRRTHSTKASGRIVTRRNALRIVAELLATTDESCAMSKALRGYHSSFGGPIICSVLMQSAGLVTGLGSRFRDGRGRSLPTGGGTALGRRRLRRRRAHAVALHDQGRDGGEAAREQLAEGPVHELRGTEDVGEVAAVVPGCRGP